MAPQPRHPVIELVDRTLGDRARTTHAKELLASGSAAIVRLVLSIGLVLVAIAAVADAAGIAWMGSMLTAAGVALAGQRTRRGNNLTRSQQRRNKRTPPRA